VGWRSFPAVVLKVGKTSKKVEPGGGLAQEGAKTPYPVLDRGGKSIYTNEVDKTSLSGGGEDGVGDTHRQKRRKGEEEFNCA